MIYDFLRKCDVKMRRMLCAVHRQPQPVSQPVAWATFKDSQDGVPSSDWYMPSFMSISTGVKVGSHTAFEFPLELTKKYGLLSGDSLKNQL